MVYNDSLKILNNGATIKIKYEEKITLISYYNCENKEIKIKDKSHLIKIIQTKDIKSIYFYD